MNSNEFVPLKDILTIAAPLIKGVIDKFIVPKIEKLKHKVSLEFQKNLIPTEEHFEDYFRRTYNRLSTVNTLAFHNTQKNLKEIYIPLSLSDSVSFQDYQIDRYPSRLTKEHKKILIKDTAGMGKSTMMKRIFLDILDSKIGIPILVELRRLSTEKSVIDEIHEQLNAINKDFDKSLLLEFIVDGEFIFILDGYDEIPLTERKLVTEGLQNFISKAANNIFFLTSRPEDTLKSFGDFHEFVIQPLRRKEAYELLKKYDSEGSVSSLLIEKLEMERFSNVDEFLTNPLLVSLLFTAFEHKQIIPFKKHIFYRQVYDANFDSHDLTKGGSFVRQKYCELDTDDFHRVLRFIGFQCLKQLKIEFSKDDLLQLISNAKKFCTGLDFTPSNFFKDLLINVPLFTQDGVYYRWAHKSLQEYFAAQFIYVDTKEQQRFILEKIVNSKEVSNYINVLDLYYDIDYKTFRNVVISNIVNSYAQHNQNNYSKIYDDVKKEKVIARKELTFLLYIVLNPEHQGSHKRINYNRLPNSIKKAITEYVVDDPLIYGTYVEQSNEQANKLIVTTYFISPKKELMRLLSSKKHALVTHDRIGSSGTFHSNVIASILNVNDYQLLSDDPNSECNKGRNFDAINFEIESYRREMHIYYRINHAVALKIKSEIDADLLNETKADFLMEGL